MLLTFSLAANADTATVNGVTWTYTVLTDSTCAITAAQNQGEILQIPSLINNKYIVTVLREGGISNKSVKEIIIPNTVERIEKNAFYLGFSYRGVLQKVTLSENLKYIGNQAFYLNTNLQSVTIPASVEKIDNSAFSGCDKLNEIIFENETAILGDECFAHCPGWEIPDVNGFQFMRTGFNEVKIQSYKQPEENMNELVIPSKVEYNGRIFYITAIFSGIQWPSEIEAFITEEDSRVYTTEDGVLFNKEKTTLIRYPLKKTDTQYTIPGTVKTIGTKAFLNVTTLKDVKLPASLITINDYAFQNCTGFTTIAIPSTVKTIGGLAFYGCQNLETVTGMEGVTTCRGEAFDKTNIKAITFPSLKTIPYEFFADNKVIETINIPKATDLSYARFRNCPNLKNINCSWNKITKLDWTFATHCGLEYLKIPSTCQIVDRYKTSSTYPNNNFDLPNLKEITVDPANKYHCSIDGVLYNKTMTQIQKYPPLKEGIGYDIPASVTSIRRSCFEGTQLKKIAILNDDLVLGDNAFQGCQNLEQIKLPFRLKEIPFLCFQNCTNLKEITIPSTVTTIWDRAFEYCSNLGEITIPNSVETIHEGAFSSNFGGLKKVFVMGNTIPILGSGAFNRSSYWSYESKWNITLYTKESTLNSYKNNYSWSRFAVITDQIPVTIAAGKQYATLALDFDADFSQTEELTPYTAAAYYEGTTAAAKVASAYQQAGMPAKARAAAKDNTIRTVVIAKFPNNYIPSRTGEDNFTFHGALLYGKPGTYYYRMGEDDYASGQQKTEIGQNNYMMPAYETWQLSPTYTEEPQNWMCYPKDDSYNFVLKDGKFKYIDNAGTVARHKAWLALPADLVSGSYHEAGAKMSMVFEDADPNSAETTGITFIEETVDPKTGQTAYNLRGQAVTDSYKGIIVRNGKAFLNNK